LEIKHHTLLGQIKNYKKEIIDIDEKTNILNSENIDNIKRRDSLINEDSEIVIYIRNNDENMKKISLELTEIKKNHINYLNKIMDDIRYREANEIIRIFNLNSLKSNADEIINKIKNNKQQNEKYFKIV